MKNLLNRTGLSTLMGLGLLAGATQAFAVPSQITIVDNSPILWGFTGDSGGPTTSGNYGVAKEDNETEKPAGAEQEWDMEAYVMNGSILSIVTGFDMLNGIAGGRPGDLFIRAGGTTPGFNPTTQTTTTVQNSLYGYNFAIDLSVSSPSFNALSFGSTLKAYALNNNSNLDTVDNDFLNSNPWKYANDRSATDFANLAYTYTTGLSSAQVDSTLGLPLSLVGTTHNILSIDLSLLSLPSTNVWFSYTMQCGNDSLKGHVAEGGVSVILLGLGLSAISLLRLPRNKRA